MNQVIMTGNLTADPELKHTKDGTARCEFRLAVNGYDEKTDYFRIKCWSKTAELVAQYLTKGSKVLIDGRLNNDNYEKDGNTVWQDAITASRVEFLSPPKDKEKEEE